MLDRTTLHAYWAKRAAVQGARTVGFGNHDEAAQDAQYADRRRFIFESAGCIRNLPTLDFGCGIGRYAAMFDTYLGMDITPALLSIAIERHPEKQFRHLEGIGLPADLGYKFEMFFTATVLQHNPDDVVLDIFRSALAHGRSKLLFALYENVEAHNHHMFGRTGDEYAGLMRQLTSVQSCSSLTHTIHGELHAFTQIEVVI